MDLEFITLNSNHAKRVDPFCFLRRLYKAKKKTDICDNNEKMVLERKTIDSLLQESSQCNSSPPTSTNNVRQDCGKSDWLNYLSDEHNILFSCCGMQFGSRRTPAYRTATR
jgi:hypothetical protein